MGILPAVDSCPAERVVGIFLVKPVVLIKDALSGILDGRHRAVHVPHALEVVVHLASAPHVIAPGNILHAITAAARKLKLLQKVDVLTLKLTVPEKVEGG